eukprot:1388202-Amorphochlora_amoeboformis.AAC.1
MAARSRPFHGLTVAVTVALGTAVSLFLISEINLLRASVSTSADWSRIPSRVRYSGVAQKDSSVFSPPLDELVRLDRTSYLKKLAILSRTSKLSRAGYVAARFITNTSFTLMRGCILAVCICGWELWIMKGDRSFI